MNPTSLHRKKTEPRQSVEIQRTSAKHSADEVSLQIPLIKRCLLQNHIPAHRSIVAASEAIAARVVFTAGLGADLTNATVFNRNRSE